MLLGSLDRKIRKESEKCNRLLDLHAPPQCIQRIYVVQIACCATESISNPYLSKESARYYARYRGISDSCETRSYRCTKVE